jgi:signal transduction histidine kinase
MPPCYVRDDPVAVRLHLHHDVAWPVALELLASGTGVMKSRGSHVRTKIVALLVSLFALWSFAAYVTLLDGLNLLWVSTLDQQVGRPTDGLITALQQERRLSLVHVGADGRTGTDQLTEARRRTDEAGATLAAAMRLTRVRWAADPAAEARVAEVLGGLRGLGGTRSAVDAGTTSRATVMRTYTVLIDSGFLVYDSLAQFDDEDIAAQGRTLVALTRSRDLLAQTDSMLSGVLAAGAFAPGEPAQLAQLVGAQRFSYASNAARLPAADRPVYDGVAAGPTLQRLTSLQNQVIEAARVGEAPTVDAGLWRSTVDNALTELRTLELGLADATVQRARPAAIWTIVRLVLAGGLGLLAVVASVIVSITTARNLVSQLERLRTAAMDLSEQRLPGVVERLQRGEKVDVAAEAPPLDFGRDEIGQVGQAFNHVQETAIRVAVEQAELRRSVRDVFLSLARRSQALLHRQLGLLDAMERRATDAEELAELFRVDHLATRMRRNAENLIVLSGATAGRAWRRPVAMVDVMRAALAEVEDYTRVTVVAPAGSTALLGRAVGDVVHLLAELIENAVSFSPPQTVVRVGGSVVGNGFAIEIEDRGLGMSDDERHRANEQLRVPPEFKLTSTARLGLYVVGKLAERHQIRVRLTESAYGGTTAIVLLPASLIAEGGSLDDSLAESGRRPSQLAAIGAVPRPSPRHAAEAAEATVAITPRPPEPVPEPSTSEPPALPRRPEPTVYTPAGLPWRRRDTGAHPRIPQAPGADRNAPPAAGTVEGPTTNTSSRAAPTGGNGTDRTGRGPEQVRTMMASYRSGTLRGRDDAARLTPPEEESPQWSIPRQDAGATDEGR